VTCSSASSLQWMADLGRAFSTLAMGKTAALDRDALFASVLRGRLGNIHRVGLDEFEIYDRETRMWLVNQKSASLCDWTKHEMAEIFGTACYGSINSESPVPQVLEKVPPSPLEKDEFISKLSQCVIKYMPIGGMRPLDENPADLLLSSDSKVLDFAQNVIRPACAEDRLFLHMPHPMPIWTAGEDLQELVKGCCKSLYEYFEAGGNSLLEAADNPLLEMKRIAAKASVQSVLDEPGLQVLRTFYETLGENMDMAVFFAVLNASLVSGHHGFVEFPILTGPPNGGKTMLCNFVIKLLGGVKKERPNDTYVESLPSNFICHAARADGEASKPVTNKLKGKRLVVIPECAALPINGDTVKPLLDSDDGGLNARANNSTSRDQTVFAVTWRLLVMRNTAVEIDPKTSFGMQNKIMEIVTPYNWVAEPDRENPRERKANMALKKAVAENLLAPEFLFWCRHLWQVLLLSKTRHMCPPRPAVFKLAEEEAFANTPEGKIRKFIADHLVSCAKEDGTHYTVIMAQLEVECGKLDKHIMRQFGFHKDCAVQVRKDGAMKRVLLVDGKYVKLNM
jgi:hypothetical protein